MGHVFPAYAGMFLEADFLEIAKNRFPRIRGDVPQGFPVWAKSN